MVDAASISNENQLTKMDCSYKDGRLGRIDLSRVGLKGGIPAFRHVLKDDYVYSYNPCYPFSEHDPCLNVAACQISKDGETFYVLGVNALVTWSVTPDGRVTLIYSTPDRQTLVNLICSNEVDRFEINNEYELRHYNTSLYSRCASESFDYHEMKVKIFISVQQTSEKFLKFKITSINRDVESFNTKVDVHLEFICENVHLDCQRRTTI